MRRRGISQSFLEVQPVSRPLEGPMDSHPADEFTVSRLIDKYANTNRITEVAEEEILLQNNSGLQQGTAKKTKPGLRTPLQTNKNASFLEKTTPQQSVKNLHDRNPKPDPPKTHTSFIQERKTVVKGIKPTIGSTITSTTSIKPNPKVDKKGIGLAHHPAHHQPSLHTENTLQTEPQ
jgi:hypothetical protein